MILSHAQQHEHTTETTRRAAEAKGVTFLQDQQRTTSTGRTMFSRIYVFMGASHDPDHGDELRRVVKILEDRPKNRDPGPQYFLPPSIFQKFFTGGTGEAIPDPEKLKNRVTTHNIYLAA